MNFIEKEIRKENYKYNNILKFRFPPEPNGYLHIGHSKAIFINFELSKKYNSKIILRFDDTNPLNGYNYKYINSIKNDIKWLNYKWSKITYASDNFSKLYKFSKKIIKKGKAYIDFQDYNTILKQRGNSYTIGTNSPYRNTNIDENLFLFKKMKEGKFNSGECVLRAKIDMKSKNIFMRDPIMYRIIYKKHFRTNYKWCIFPTYDWAHGQCDYIESITHSICSIEFIHHKLLYNWYINQIYDKNINTIKPKQIEFSRLNLEYNITSKRNLNIIIQKKIVNDWEDPRLCTLKGLKNRGFPNKSILLFIKEIGFTKRNSIIKLSKLEFYVEKILKKKSVKVIVIFKLFKIIIINYNDLCKKDVKIKFENLNILLTNIIYVEFNDIFFIKKNKYITKYNKGEYLKLIGGIIIKIIDIVYYKNKKPACIYSILCKNKIKNIKNILWISNNNNRINIIIYNKLFNKHDIFNYNINKILKYINLNSKIMIYGYCDIMIYNLLKLNKYYKFVNVGYFYLDKKKLYFNSTIIFNKFILLNNFEYLK